jgi:hypothetical protein
MENDAGAAWGCRMGLSRSLFISMALRATVDSDIIKDKGKRRNQNHVCLIQVLHTNSDRSIDQ